MKKNILIIFLVCLLLLTGCVFGSNDEVKIRDDDVKQKELVEKFPNIKSKVDFNNNGIDDYSDFVIGARKDAKNHP